MHLLSLLTLWLAALLPAQQPAAKAEYFARADGTLARGVIQIRVAPGWHLYAADLGDSNVAGLPLKLAFEGQGLRWSATRHPEAEHERQEFGSDDKPATANVYRGTVAIYLSGELDTGADLSQAHVLITGQTCKDNGQCVPLSLDVPLVTPGPDAVFADFPGELVAASAAPAALEDDFEPFQDAAANAKVELFTRAEGGEARAAIVITIDKGWHLFHEQLGPDDAIGMPTTITLGGAGIEWGPPVWPEPLRVDTPIGLDDKPTWILQHEGTIVVRARGKLASGADVAQANVSVQGQTCQETCTPLDARVRSSGRGADSVFAEPGTAVGAASPDSAPTEQPQQPLGTFLWLAVFWGVFSLLMPCTYPMIPITISFFTKQASQSKSKQLSLSLLYGLGIVLMFILIGVVVGAPIIRFANHPLTNIVIGALFIVFALSLFGLFNLEPPRFLMNAAGQARMTGGYLGVFLMGTTLVITSFTCTAPFVGSLLSVGAVGGGYGRIVLGMGTFGLTMAVPFVILSLIPAKLKALPRSGEWMNTLKVTLGFVELAAALKFVSNADVAYKWGILPREVFLMLWFGILLAAALYLFGMIRYHGESGEIGGGRLVAGIGFLCFSCYCLFGALGNQLDIVMTALAPPYSSTRIAGFTSGGATVAQAEHEIVADDFEAALARAREQHKLVLINFTGHL